MREAKSQHSKELERQLQDNERKVKQAQRVLDETQGTRGGD